MMTPDDILPDCTGHSSRNPFDDDYIQEDEEETTTRTAAPRPHQRLEPAAENQQVFRQSSWTSRFLSVSTTSSLDNSNSSEHSDIEKTAAMPKIPCCCCCTWGFLCRLVLSLAGWGVLAYGLWFWLGKPSDLHDFADDVLSGNYSWGGHHPNFTWPDVSNFTNVLEKGVNWTDLIHKAEQIEGAAQSWLEGQNDNPINHFDPNRENVDTNLRSGDHWPVNLNGGGGLSLTIQNACDESWKAELDAALDDWDESSVLNLTRTMAAAADPRCHPVEGLLKVCNGNYGDTGWLGINEVLVVDSEENGGTIHSSVAKLNEYYLYNADTATRQYTACHELGHGLGLMNTDEDLTNADLGNCMDVTTQPQNNLHPDETNFAELRKLYGMLQEEENTTSSTIASEVNLNDIGMKTPGGGAADAAQPEDDQDEADQEGENVGGDETEDGVVVDDAQGTSIENGEDGADAVSDEPDDQDDDNAADAIADTDGGADENGDDAGDATAGNDGGDATNGDDAGDADAAADTTTTNTTSGEENSSSGGGTTKHADAPPPPPPPSGGRQGLRRRRRVRDLEDVRDRALRELYAELQRPRQQPKSLQSGWIQEEASPQTTRSTTFSRRLQGTGMTLRVHILYQQ